MYNRIGVFGKLPCAGDFQAHNVAAASGRAFQNWMQIEVDNLAKRSKQLPDAPFRFLYRDPSGSGALLGVFIVSRDAVGRAFPLSAFAYVQMPVACHRFPSLSAAYAPFLDGAAAVLRERESLDLPGVVNRIDALPHPTPEQLEEARVWTHQAQEATAGQTIIEALFGPISGGVQYHGFNMFLTACSGLKGRFVDKARIILECPATDDVQLAFWLLLAEEALQWRRAPPSLFWTDQFSRDSRLLIALGAPDGGVLHFLADPTAVADRLWPMRTTSAASIETGRSSLGERVKFIEPPAPTAAALIAALVR